MASDRRASTCPPLRATVINLGASELCKDPRNGSRAPKYCQQFGIVKQRACALVL